VSHFHLFKLEQEFHQLIIKSIKYKFISFDTIVHTFVILEIGQSGGKSTKKSKTIQGSINSSTRAKINKYLDPRLILQLG